MASGTHHRATLRALTESARRSPRTQTRDALNMTPDRTWPIQTLLLLLTLALGTSHAQAEEAAERAVQPATWGIAAELFNERIEVPSPTPRALMFVRCFGAVRDDGTIARVDCNPNRENRAYSEQLGLAVSAAAVGLRLQPAQFDGQPVPLKRFPFSVMVAPRPDDPFGPPLTKVVANHLLETSTFGTEYTAPQEVLTDMGLPRCRAEGAPAFAFSVRITKRGETGDITVADEDARSLCERDLRRYLEASVFIPASHEGSFVDAAFLDSVAGGGPGS